MTNWIEFEDDHGNFCSCRDRELIAFIRIEKTFSKDFPYQFWITFMAHDSTGLFVFKTKERAMEVYNKIKAPS